MEAEVLIQAHGERAWSIAFARARDMSLPAQERIRAVKVRDEIGRRLGKSYQPDTSTRYLED